jgi:hypothetical protein
MLVKENKARLHRLFLSLNERTIMVIIIIWKPERRHSVWLWSKIDESRQQLRTAEYGPDSSVTLQLIALHSEIDGLVL